jgi:hypothetical protein
VLFFCLDTRAERRVDLPYKVRPIIDGLVQFFFCSIFSTKTIVTSCSLVLKINKNPERKHTAARVARVWAVRTRHRCEHVAYTFNGNDVTDGRAADIIIVTDGVGT